MRERLRCAFQPGLGGGRERRLQCAVVIGGHRVEALARQALLQLPERGLRDELRRQRAAAAGRLHGQRRQCARVAVRAGVQVRVDDQPAAHEGIDEDVQEALQVMPAPAHQLGHAGGHGVAREAHRHVGARAHLGRQVHLVPQVGLRLRQPQRAMPAAELERRREPHAHVARGQRPQAVAQPVDVLRDGGQQLVHVGKVVMHDVTITHPRGEVDQQPLGAAPAHLDADGERAVGVQRQRHRRLADAPAHAVLLDDEPVFLEPRGDEPDGLRAQPGEPREVGLGQARVNAQRLQHRAFVELAHADLVGAAKPQQVGRARGGVRIRHAPPRATARRSWRRSSRPPCRSC